MYAAAGGASLASRRHKPKHRNTADADALIHQQFQRRFEQHQQQYAPASVEHHLRASSSLTPSTPMSPFGQVRLPGPFDHEVIGQPDVPRRFPVANGLLPC